jgi:periplasmic protein TonB
MNTDMILKSDVLDILFEKRNKLYGAYTLRKFYPERIKTSLVIMLCVVIAFCLFTVIPKLDRKQMEVITFDDPGFRKINPDNKIPEPKPKVAASKVMVRTVKFPATVKIVNEKDSADRLPENLENERIGSVNSTYAVDGDIPGGTSNTSVSEPAVAVKVTPVLDPNVPIDNPDVEPSYPGGINALRTFLRRNLTNPGDLEEGEQVSVQIKFIVGYDGKLQRFETIKDGGEEFNSEVIRVLKKMPQWIAGKSNGRNVSVYYTISVKFVPKD